MEIFFWRVTGNHGFFLYSYELFLVCILSIEMSKLQQPIFWMPFLTKRLPSDWGLISPFFCPQVNQKNTMISPSLPHCLWCPSALLHCPWCPLASPDYNFHVIYLSIPFNASILSGSCIVKEFAMYYFDTITTCTAIPANWSHF